MGRSNRYYCSPLCGGWKRTHSPRRHGIIATVGDLASFLGAEGIQGMNRRLYKDTRCGASISLIGYQREWHNGQDWSEVEAEPRLAYGFTIQTIVEGSDATVDSDLFRFPVKAREVRQWITEMEAQAAEIAEGVGGEEDE